MDKVIVDNTGRWFCPNCYALNYTGLICNRCGKEFEILKIINAKEKIDG